MRRALFFVIPLFLLLTSCGQRSKNARKHRSGERGTQNISTDDWIVRGAWRLQYGSAASLLDEGLHLAGASSSHQMTANVPEIIAFNVDETNFVMPTDPSEGDQSFGSLDIVNLRDNKLRVCGANGNAQCSVAALRVYTTGKPGAGLWNDDAGYGLTISTNGTEVGLDAANAVELGSVDVSGMRRLSLSDFTSSASIQVPLSVNFDNAGAGSYGATIVMEYVLQ